MLCTLLFPSLLASSHPKPCKFRTELYFFSPFCVSPNLVNCSQNVLSHSLWNLKVNPGYSPFISFQQILWILLIVPSPISQSLVSTPSNPIPQLAKVLNTILKYKLLCHSTKMSLVFSPTPDGQNGRNANSYDQPLQSHPDTSTLGSFPPPPPAIKTHTLTHTGYRHLILSLYCWNHFPFCSLFTWLISILRKLPCPSTPFQAELSTSLCASTDPYLP